MSLPTELGVRGGVPVYVRLKETIRAGIDAGQWKIGDTIPSEREICAAYGISRMTARQAIGDLVHEGVLTRRQGRGTFVARGGVRDTPALARGRRARAPDAAAIVRLGWTGDRARGVRVPRRRVPIRRRARRTDGGVTGLGPGALVWAAFDGETVPGALLDAIGQGRIGGAPPLPVQGEAPSEGT